MQPQPSSVVWAGPRAFLHHFAMMQLAVVAIVLAAVVAGPASAAIGADIRGSLLSQAPLPANVQAPDDETILRSRPAHVGVDLLDAMDWADIGQALEITFFEDVTAVAVLERHVRRADDSYTWIGSLVDDVEQAIEQRDIGAWFVLAVHQGVMVGNFWTADGRSFEVRPAGEGLDVYFVHETLQENYPDCETCLEHAVAPGVVRHRNAAKRSGLLVGEQTTSGDRTSEPQQIGGSPCGEDDGSIIDVLIVYTPAARNWAGGTNAIIALSHAAMDATNHSYNNSEIETQVRLVYLGETDYTESGNNGTDLSRLRNTNGLYMHEVHSLRDEYGADMVALINYAPDSGSCGVAYLMTNLSTGFASSAFSVTRSSCAVGNLTFAHELGHNQGSAHDRDNAGNALFAYSYGYRWTTTGGTLRRSVMAYQPGNRVPHFSNPDVLNGGVPTGIAHPHPQSADNARSINNAAWTVANFRPSVCNPENNLCTSPQIVPEGVHAFSNLGATTDGPMEGGSCNLQADVWFGLTAQCDGELTVSLCGSDFNTVLALYAFDCPTSPGQFIACNSNSCGQQSQLTIPVTAGQAVRIRVGGEGGAEGEGVLTITCEPTIEPCPGDLTGSGVVDVSDLLQLLGAWGPCSGCPEDITGDGVVEVSDLLELLANWGPCPKN